MAPPNGNRSVDTRQVKRLVERDDIASILQRIDYRLWEEQEPVDAELAEETFGYLAAPMRVDFTLDFSGITLYVEQELSYLAEKVPNSYFDRLYDGEPHQGYRITGDDCYVELYFDRTHGGDRIAVSTIYDYLEVYVPTVDAYIEYSRENL